MIDGIDQDLEKTFMTKNTLDEVVRGNDWKALEPKDIGEGSFIESVSIILPCFMGQNELEMTLAGLAKQTYPDHLFEAIVVDDGSNPPINISSELPFSATVIAQRRDGFGLARARNLGAHHAKGKILVFLDCDMIPEPQLVEAHARWHSINKFLLTLGFRHHADFSEISVDSLANVSSPKEVISGKRVTSPQWIEFHMRRTGELTSDDSDLFRIATGGNLGIRKSFFEEIGGFDSSFRQWGGEDIEFGFRAFNSGGILVPERLATAWHQGLGASPDPSEEASLIQQRHRLSHLIPERTFRKPLPGRSFEIPMLTVLVDATHQNYEEVSAQVDSILGSVFHDLVIGLKIPDAHPEKINIERQYGPDPRVVISVDIQEDIPNAAFRLEIPPKLCLSSSGITFLIQSLEKCGVSRVEFESFGEIRIALNRILRRVQQTHDGDPWENAELFFGVNAIEESGFSSHVVNVKNIVSAAPSLNPPFWTLTIKVLKKIVSVRTPADVINLFRWSSRGFINVIRRMRFADFEIGSGSVLRRSRIADWLRIAGDRSHFPNIRPWSGSRDGVEVLIVSPGAAIEVENHEVPEVSLGETSGIPLAPPFDEKYFNPAEFRPVRTGSNIESFPEVGKTADRIRKARSLLAVEVDRVDSIESAHQVVEYAALGVPIVVRDQKNAISWLGEGLVKALGEVNEEKLSDPTERERVSVLLRRSALRDHTISNRLKQIRMEAGLAVFKEPSISVVLVTNRPEMLTRIIEVIKSQDYSNLELILALHGNNFEEINDSLFDGELPVTVLRFPEETIFGNVLSEASAVAQGEWIAKMDDDDWYGCEHISDLLLAAKYSKADLVGKGSEFVYLEEKDLTIRRNLGNSEVESRTLAGGTLLFRSEILKDINGWRGLSKGIDVSLIEDVVNIGGRTWRTHPFGYLLRRTIGQHTWKIEDSYFLRQAEMKWEGIPYDLIGIIED